MMFADFDLAQPPSPGDPDAAARPRPRSFCWFWIALWLFNITMIFNFIDRFHTTRTFELDGTLVTVEPEQSSPTPAGDGTGGAPQRLKPEYRRRQCTVRIGNEIVPAEFFIFWGEPKPGMPVVVQEERRGLTGWLIARTVERERH